MALKIDTKTVHGIRVSGAYHRVECVQIAGKNKIKFQVRACTATELPHFSDVGYESDYDMNGENPIAQAYRHLKTLPDFVGAVYC